MRDDIPRPDRHDKLFSVAPMMEWTDRHCRTFHRALSREAWLYTEMVTTQAVLHGNLERLLGRGEEGDRVVLQLGGNEPAALAECARLGETFGYQAINLNCGCPSDRVQQGAFGACLMARPVKVAEGVTAMREAVAIPVTVKHRIGLDHVEDYSFVRDFVGTVGLGGCSHFIVHARNAWLDGLSPKENREIPPLRHEVVHRLAADFPGYTFEINGGLQSLTQAVAASAGLAGAMIGRAAYHQPYLLAEVDGTPPVSRSEVVEAMVAYLVATRTSGVEVRHLARHMLGLYHGEPAARRWRRMLSDSELLAANDPGLLLRARDAVETPAQRGLARAA